MKTKNNKVLFIIHFGAILLMLFLMYLRLPYLIGGALTFSVKMGMISKGFSLAILSIFVVELTLIYNGFVITKIFQAVLGITGLVFSAMLPVVYLKANLPDYISYNAQDFFYLGITMLISCLTSIMVQHLKRPMHAVH